MEIMIKSWLLMYWTKTNKLETLFEWRETYRILWGWCKSFKERIEQIFKLEFAILKAFFWFEIIFCQFSASHYNKNTIWCILRGIFENFILLIICCAISLDQWLTLWVSNLTCPSNKQIAHRIFAHDLLD